MVDVKIIWDDDQDNPQTVDLPEGDLVTYLRQGPGGTLPLVEYKKKGVEIPGEFVYYLKRFQPFNAGAAYKQEDGTMWIQTTEWEGNEPYTIILAYNDGYAKGWELD